MIDPGDDSRESDRVPVQSAATVMVLDERPELRVLMLRRRRGSAFVGGMTLFPGGGVDAGDAAADVESLCPALREARASERLGLDRGGLAYWVAAIRETFEEAGVLLAGAAGSGAPLDLSDAARARRFAAHRDDVDRGRVAFLEVVRREQLVLAVASMAYVARWITPPGAPRRYDTRFFLARLPVGQTPLHDDREAVHSEWLAPAAALEGFASGELAMLPPTVGMLRILAGFESSDAAMAAAFAAQDGADRPVCFTGPIDRWRVRLPGDADYAEVAPQRLKAWVRLCPSGAAPEAAPGRGFGPR
jgi:8-oxo-dGTP pyrophosphatase MutT (NUDIX family)